MLFFLMEIWIRPSLFVRSSASFNNKYDFSCPEVGPIK